MSEQLAGANAACACSRRLGKPESPWRKYLLRYTQIPYCKHNIAAQLSKRLRQGQIPRQVSQVRSQFPCKQYSPHGYELSFMKV